MGLGTSLLLIALGAILRFAVHVTTHGFNVHTIGVILMVVGIIGLLVSLFWMTAWSDRRRRTYGYDDARGPVIRRRERIVESDDRV
jgi:sulfite exporter TauE/SafE